VFSTWQAASAEHALQHACQSRELTLVMLMSLFLPPPIPPLYIVKSLPCFAQAKQSPASTAGTA